MARLALLVDAPGDKILTADGWSKRWTAPELFGGGGGHQPLLDNANVGNPRTGMVPYLWNPPHSQWILPRPYQFRGNDWKDHVRFSEHVVKKANWVFSVPDAEVRTSTSFSTPGTGVPDDEWIQMVGHATAPALITVDFNAIADTVRRAHFPASMQVLACTVNAIPGQVTPFFQWAQFPEPNDVMLFGFGDMCLYTDARQIALLRSPNNDQQTWEILWGQSRVGPLGSPFWRWAQNFWESLHWNADKKAVMVIPVGFDALYLMRSATSPPWMARVHSPPAPGTATASGASPADPLVRANKWWIAAPGQQLAYFQVQTMGYEYGLYNPVITDPAQIDPEDEWFNMGQNNVPPTGQDPQVGLSGLMLKLSTTTLSFPAVTAGFRATNPDDGQQLTVQLLDEQCNPWASDGTHFRGTMYLELSPCTTPTGLFGRDCWSPQLLDIQVRFLPLLDDRPSTGLLLYDNRRGSDPGGFKPGWTAVTSMREPGQKQMSFPLTTHGAVLMQTSDLHLKHDYSIVLCEADAFGNFLDGGGNPINPRIRGWVSEPMEKVERALVSGDPDLPVWEGVIHARGLMERANEPWVFRHALLDPTAGGVLKHLDAVSGCFRQAGIDITDPTKYSAEADPADDALQTLPGNFVEASEFGVAFHEPWEPEWDETKLAYAIKVAHQWRKWLLYEELDGRIVYAHDPIDDILDSGATFTSQAIFYRTRTLALAGTGDARQVYHTASNVTAQRVETNVIRIVPTVAGLPMVLMRDQRSVNDPSYENYVGFYVRPRCIWTKLATNQSALEQLAAFALLRLRRRVRTRVWTSPLPPWQIEAGIDLNAILQLQDGPTLPGDQFQSVKIAVEGIGLDQYLTTITGEVLPAPTVFP